MARSSEPATGSSFESRAHEILTRWSCERELLASRDDAEAARRYLDGLHVRTLATDDGRFVLEKTGRVVGRAELVLLGLRQLVVRRRATGPTCVRF